jgi:phosphatidylserine/phosphatidylglycerophosphate/cardiolipin synthase-like enzyme
VTGALLECGVTCARVFDDAPSGLLIDGRDFYRAVHDACRQARRTILMTGWQFDSRVPLLRGADADGAELPTRFLALLSALCRERPELEVYLLAWDASAFFTFEREPLQKFVFHWRGHRRIHYRMDSCHPVGASQHQKLIVVDRGIAFLGGMDVCSSRWDDRDHRARDARRRTGWRRYAPYHDVQAYVSGDAVDVLRDWFGERWRLATGDELRLSGVPRRAMAIEPTCEVRAPVVALSRTWPEMEQPPTPAVCEIAGLHHRAIANAERVLYMENQYFSSDELGRAVIERLERQGASRLEIALVLPEKSAGFKERIAIGVYQAEILERIVSTAAREGHRVGVYYTAASGPDGDVPVFIHSKVLAVDDRFLLVSSANATNRSMSFDSELGIAWEAPAPTDSLRDARVELMREHVGLEGQAAHEVLAPIPGLIDRLDRIARDRSGRLRLHRLNRDERPGPILSRLLPSETPFDPDRSMLEEMLPEPGVFLDRILRDPLVLLGAAARRFGRRFTRRRSTTR